ncbi:MAG: hypothetical protein ACTSX1_00620 [Candidatus Heimdallarchaeaceae archaeon]
MSKLDKYLDKIQHEWGGVDVKKEKKKAGHAITMKASQIDQSTDRKCQASKNSNTVKCKCRGLKAAATYLKNNVRRCKGDSKCVAAVRKYLQGNVALIKKHC